MFKSTLKKKSTINIIPMIDVIFFLLVFFMLFTTFRSTPQGIDLQLPKAVTVTKQEDKNMVVDISEKGEVFVGGDKVSLAGLRRIADKRYKKNNELVIVINADREVKYDSIVSVMDNLRQVGIYKLALAADKKE